MFTELGQPRRWERPALEAGLSGAGGGTESGAGVWGGAERGLWGRGEAARGSPLGCDCRALLAWASAECERG